MEERLTELYQGVAVHATADREHMAADEIVAEHLLLHQLDFLRRSLGLAHPD